MLRRDIDRLNITGTLTHAGMLAPLAIPVSVEDVAKVALAAALGKEEVVSRDSPILSDADILSISTLLK